MSLVPHLKRGKADPMFRCPPKVSAFSYALIT